VDGQGHNFFGQCFLTNTDCVVHVCQNLRCLEDKRTSPIHLCKNGFVPGYEVWTFHYESGTRVIAKDEHDCDVGDVDRMDKMLEAIQEEVTEDLPTTEVEAFFKFSKLRKSRFMNTQK
jgi:hypothetical protein